MSDLDQPAKKKEFVQLAALEKTNGWLIGGKLIPFKDLKDNTLLEALVKAEARELWHFNRSSFFGELVRKLTDEIELRGLEPKHLDTEFTIKNAEALKKSKES